MRPRPKLRLKLRERYALTIAILVLTVAATLAMALLYQFERSSRRLAETSFIAATEQIDAQMRKRGEMLVTVLAEAVGDPLYLYDTDAMYQFLTSATAGGDIVYAYIYDNEAKIVHDGDRTIARYGEDLRDPQAKKALGAPNTLVTRVEGDVLSVSRSIWVGDSPLGGVKVGLPLQGVREDLRAMRARHLALQAESATRNLKVLAVTAFVLLCVGVALAGWTANRLIRPIRTLAAYAGEIGRGNYSVKLEVERGDEIGELAQSFNNMSRELCRTTVSRDYVENIVGSMNDPLVVVDRDGIIEGVNPALLESLGYDRDEIVDAHFSSLLPEDEAANAREWLVEPDTGDSASVRNGHYATKDGRRIPVSVSISSLRDKRDKRDKRDGRGDDGGFVLVAQDVTEQRRVQEAMRQAVDEAEAASRAKSEFLARMSHEIRTPMNGVLGMTELLMGSTLTDRQRHYADAVYRSAESLLDVINDVLDYSKIEAGKLELEHIDFNVRDAVEEIAELFAEQAYGKGLELATVVSAHVPRLVAGDPVRLRQIVTNLVGNALKFTEEGEVSIHVSVAETGPSNALLRFEVRDTGIGIPEEVQRRIFDSFSQADGSTTRQFGGTGLGLTIARELAQLMGGTIGVASEPGRGSAFWFTARLSLRTPEANALAELPAGLKASRVLVVDDSATGCAVLCELLEAWGIDYACVAGGTEALDRLRIAVASERAYDIAILDERVSGSGGTDVVRAIRADQSLAGTRIVVLTAAPQDWPGGPADRVDDVALVRKPVRQSGLFDALVECCAGTTLRSSDLQPPSPKADREDVAAQTRVLLVEDNPVNQEVARAMLAAMGCDVDVANNGAFALEAIDDHRFELVLMDCQMPVMDGYEATRRIRAGEAASGVPQHGEASRSRLPIVALTANAMKGDRELCLSAGMDDYLSKPFTQDQLAGVIRKWTAGVAGDTPTAAA